MAARDRLKPNSKANYTPGMQINPPPVRVRLPEINLPDVHIGEVNIPDSAMVPIAEEIAKLAQGMMQIAQQQQALLQVLQQLAGREVKVEVKASDVKIPARKNGSYRVELIKDGDETIGMDIVSRRSS